MIAPSCLTEAIERQASFPVLSSYHEAETLATTKAPEGQRNPPAPVEEMSMVELRCHSSWVVAQMAVAALDSTVDTTPGIRTVQAVDLHSTSRHKSHHIQEVAARLEEVHLEGILEEILVEKPVEQHSFHRPTTSFPV